MRREKRGGDVRVDRPFGGPAVQERFGQKRLVERAENAGEVDAHLSPHGKLHPPRLPAPGEALDQRRQIGPGPHVAHGGGQRPEPVANLRPWPCLEIRQIEGVGEIQRGSVELARRQRVETASRVHIGGSRPVSRRSKVVADLIRLLVEPVSEDGGVGRNDHLAGERRREAERRGPVAAEEALHRQRLRDRVHDGQR